MIAFNKAVAVVFNSSGDDNCGLRDGLLVKAAAVRLNFRAVIAACQDNANQELWHPFSLQPLSSLLDPLRYDDSGIFYYKQSRNKKSAQTT